MESNDPAGRAYAAPAAVNLRMRFKEETMKRRMVMTLTLILVLAGAAGIPRAAAQESTEAPVKTQGKEEATPPKSIDSYNIDFTVSELDNGKKINSRSYSMQMPNIPFLRLPGGSPPWTDWKRVRVGSQIPIPAGEKGFTYKDVGMDIDCRYFLMGNGKLTMATTWDYTSMGGDQERNNPTPVFRHVRSEVEAVVPLDKPTVISEVDDVASTHRYVFEVKVTKINP